MTTLRKAAQQALEVLERAGEELRWQAIGQVQRDLRAALAEPEQEPVAWMHNNIRDNIISHPPADLKRHPERWTALYSEPKPCPTCVALSRAVMMDQTAHDAPPQRKPLTDEQCVSIFREAFLASSDPLVKDNMTVAFARAIEEAHGII